MAPDDSTGTSRPTPAAVVEGANSTWVFAYGSNMALDDLDRRFLERQLPRGVLHRSVAATLPGFRLVWNFYSATRDGGAANVQPGGHGELPGVALEIDAVMWAGIDRKEGYPTLYRRSQETVLLATGESIRAWVYLVNPEHLLEEFVAPTHHYRSLLVTGARAHGLPSAYILELEQLPTAD